MALILATLGSGRPLARKAIGTVVAALALCGATAGWPQEASQRSHVQERVAAQRCEEQVAILDKYDPKKNEVDGVRLQEREFWGQFQKQLDGTYATCLRACGLAREAYVNGDRAAIYAWRRECGMGTARNSTG